MNFQPHTKQGGLSWILIAISLATSSSCYHNNPLELTDFPIQKFGKVDPNRIDASRQKWSVGCETLDRNYANFDAYKEYLTHLGIQRIRIQGGWARTETVKGVYDFAWLDNIINYSHDVSIRPWVQLSYGNDIYINGGHSRLGSPFPTSQDALEAWDLWVTEMVSRYGQYVYEWEIWNEPDQLDIDASQYAQLYIRTAKIIKQLQPHAKLYALALSRLQEPYVRQFINILKTNNALHLVDIITYHGYVYRPEEHYTSVLAIRETLSELAPHITLFQGENGAPTRAPTFGALSEYNWSETSQAKWNIRRMVSDFRYSIPTSIFSIIDMKNPSGWNYKGLLKANENLSVDRPKAAFNSVRQTISLLDDRFVIADDYDKNYVSFNTCVTTFRFQDIENLNIAGVVYWAPCEVPKNINEYGYINSNNLNLNLDDPVLVDLLTGDVYNLVGPSLHSRNSYINFNLPIYDSPMVIIDRAYLKIIPN